MSCGLKVCSCHALVTSSEVRCWCNGVNHGHLTKSQSIRCERSARFDVRCGCNEVIMSFVNAQSVMWTLGILLSPVSLQFIVLTRSSVEAVSDIFLVCGYFFYRSNDKYTKSRAPIHFLRGNRTRNPTSITDSWKTEKFWGKCKIWFYFTMFTASRKAHGLLWQSESVHPMT